MNQQKLLIPTVKNWSRFCIEAIEIIHFIDTMALNNNSFTDATSNSGIKWSRHRGDEAFSIAWVDYNNDGRLDLWVSGHGYNNAFPKNPTGKFPFLYINQGNGKFNNIFTEDWRRGNGGDTHGTTWIDFDNDGDQDVLVSGGGELGQTNDGQPNLFFVNNNGTLRNEAASRNIEYSIGRSRSSIWVDVNRDGRLDIVELVALREDGRGPTVYFEQRPNGTFKDPVNLNLPGGSRYAQLADLTGDGHLELIVQGTYQYPIRVFDTSSGKIRNITNQFNFPLTSENPSNETQDFFNRTSARDSIIADFDNDGDNDFFLTRSDVALSNDSPSVYKAGNDIVVAELLNMGRQIGFSFKTGGQIALDISDIFERESNLTASQIFIGASGRNPTAAELRAFINTDTADSINLQEENTNRPSLVLSGNSAGVTGLKANRSQRGIYIGYNPNTQTWQVQASSNDAEIWRAIVESTAPVNDVQAINFNNPNPASRALSDQLWTYNSSTGNFINRTQAAGLNTPTLAQSAVAADFDNDKDIDIYIANATTTINQPNILYENRGDGTFRTVEMAGGASGSRIGPSHLDFNIGARLATADYNNDGAVDIFVASTTMKTPRKTYLGTPPQLFRNRGNNNNWILIDLEGVESNRDAIGAQVKLTSGGVTQLREQNGGIHVFAQNDTRLHFGLGQDSKIDKLEIRWPSGKVQTLNNVGVNRILKIRENGSVVNSSTDSPGGDSEDNIIGTSAPNNLSGGDGNDTISGRGGADTIVGGGGDDILLGESGRDSMTGGAGADDFVYNVIGHSNDFITDFESGQDKIVISASAFGGGLTPGAVSADQFVLGSSATDSSDRFLYNANNGRVLFDPDGTGSAGKIVIATLENKPAFDSNDLEIVV